MSDHSDKSNYGQKSYFSSKESVSSFPHAMWICSSFKSSWWKDFFLSSQRRDEIHLSLGYKRIRELVSEVWGILTPSSLWLLKKKISFLSCVCFWSHLRPPLLSPWLLLGLQTCDKRKRLLRDQTGGVLVVELSLRSKLLCFPNSCLHVGLCPQARPVWAFSLNCQTSCACRHNLYPQRVSLPGGGGEVC